MRVYKDGELNNHSLLFLHGYNVTFEEAAVRTAQLSFDLHIVPACFFSWPSGGGPSDYAADEAVIEASADAIADFVRKAVCCANEADSTIHIIGHSMGNRALLRSLEAIATLSEDSGLTIENIVFAAPDVDSRVFRQSIAKIQTVGVRKTLYATQSDRAVGLSRFIHKSERAGILPPVTVAAGVDTIDATAVNETFLGHSYIANVRALLTDLGSMLAGGLDPAQRVGLERTKDEMGNLYWRLI